MRRVRNSFIAILLAVLTIGAAFADVSTETDAAEQKPTLRILAAVEAIVEPYLAEGERSPRTYPQVAAQRERLQQYAERIEANGRRAAKTVRERLLRLYPEADNARVICALSTDWKMLGTLLYTYGERMTDALKRNLEIRIEQTEPVPVARLAFAPFDDMLRLDSETDWFAARNTYYYLNTVYDDGGAKRKPTAFNMPQEKLDRLAFPLDAKWYSRIKTTWFRGRDGGTRFHTGMDIRCAHGSPIYACAGGTVNSVGYHAKGGYYVSVRDPDGYEYFYYHMKKNSQCVERGQTVKTGQQLGLSGNTGNSAAPHLHLSVITPDRRFVDPFPIYYRWVYRHTGRRIKKPS